MYFVLFFCGRVIWNCFGVICWVNSCGVDGMIVRRCLLRLWRRLVFCCSIFLRLSVVVRSF